MGLPGALGVYHPIMISIYSFSSIREIGTLLALCHLFRLVNFLYFFSSRSPSYIDSLDGIQLIFFGFILHTFAMPWVYAILLMCGPIGRIGGFIRRITDTHIAQHSIANSG